MRRPAWVVTTYVVLLLPAVAAALPNFLPTAVRSTLPYWANSQTVSLGFDLQGGAHLFLAVDREDPVLAWLAARSPAAVSGPALQQAGQAEHEPGEETLPAQSAELRPDILLP